MLNFPKVGETKLVLAEKLAVDKYLIPRGTEISLCRGNLLVLPAGCVDARGFPIPKRIFKINGEASTPIPKLLTV